MEKTAANQNLKKKLRKKNRHSKQQIMRKGALVDKGVDREVIVKIKRNKKAIKLKVKMYK